MRRIKKVRFLFWFTMAVIIGLHLLALNVFAAENPNGWRPTYDIILRWLNFGILFFILVKYLRRPLLDFLRGQREVLARDINRAEEEKKRMLEKIDQTLQMVDQSRIRFAALKDRMLDQGEKKKEMIIQQAREQSRMMIEEAKRRAEYQILQARANFKSELIDAAIDMAAQRLPTTLTPEDRLGFIDRYLATAAGSIGRLL